MTQFNAGDKVICVRGTEVLHEGQEYTIRNGTYIGVGGAEYVVLEGQEGLSGMYSDRFMLKPQGIDWTKEVTNDGGVAITVLSTNAKGKWPVVVQFSWGGIAQYNLEGKEKGGKYTDIIQKPKAKACGVGYINIYKDHNGKFIAGSPQNTLLESLECASQRSVFTLPQETIARVKVEWTEGVFQE